MKEESFQKKLAQYITMSAAFLAAHAENADAQIIYTDVIPDDTMHNSFFNLDLNNDGVTDFKLVHFEHFGIGINATYSAQNQCLNGNQQVDSFSYNTANQTFNTNYWPLALNNGDTVGTQQHFNSQGYAVLHLLAVWSFATNTSGQPGTSTGTWSFGNVFGINKYLGLKINANGNTYYGWVRLDVSDHQIILKDYAINLNPDSSIVAGETGSQCLINPPTTIPTGQVWLCNDTVSIQLFGSNGLNVQWMKDGQWIAGETDSAFATSLTGNYEVLVSDSICSFLINAVQLDTMKITEYHEDATCGFSNGYIYLFLNGGIPPYSFNWSNGSTTQYIGNLSPGLYSVTVTGNNGCNNESINIINNFNPPLVTDVQSDSACLNDGYIDLSVSGGNGAYYYSWNNGSTNQDLNNISPGNYSVTVSDLNCQIPLSFNIVNGFPSIPIITEQNDTLFSSFQGQNQWCFILPSNPISGATLNYYVPLNAGIYYVAIDYTNACRTVSDPYNFNFTSIKTIESPELNFSIADKKITFQLNNPLLGDEIIIYNELGAQVASTKIENENPVIDLSLAPTGIYFYHIRSKQKYYGGKFFIE